MFVGVLQVELGVPGAFSLKEKRSVVKSILERVRRRFSVAAAEVGALDTWNRAEIGISCVSGDKTHAERQLRKIIDALENEKNAVVLDAQLEVL